MSDQAGRQATAPPYPSPEDTKGWKASWKKYGPQWRTMPPISTERQEYLASRRLIQPTIEQGISPCCCSHKG
jgi:hypothetical protein